MAREYHQPVYLNGSAVTGRLYRILWMLCMAAAGSGGGAFAQQPAHGRAVTVDSVIRANVLSEVVIKAFETDKRLIDQPSSVYFLDAGALRRYDNTSIVPAVNMIPGVRMEERSPGSYRLNIRGSTLRSPFGVRNVKVYYNGIPYTNPGGDTYLNQLSFYNFGSVEIIKGPAGSAYGAGTGGVMLIGSPLLSDSINRFTAAVTAGSFGLRLAHGAFAWGDSTTRSRVAYTGLHSEGYRAHTALKRRVLSYETLLERRAGRALSLYAHYADLYYETPGALTLSQYRQDPRAARPAAGAFPSAEASRASIRQRSAFVGMKNDYRLSGRLRNTTVLYGAFSKVENPAIRNYEIRLEPHFGGRTVFSWKGEAGGMPLGLQAGAEVQQGFFNTEVRGNKGGTPDTLQTDDYINNFRAFVFAQADISFPQGWDLTAGASINRAALKFTRLSPAPGTTFQKHYRNRIAPRVALLKKLGSRGALYADVSKGFSPPSVSELLPSTTVINTGLEAEEGVSLEAGSRGTLFRGRLYYDIDAFLFDLKESISLRRDSSGADYFVNAGGTRQHGIESYLSYAVFRNRAAFITSADVRASQTWSAFRYKNYRGAGEDYSGRHLPGVAPYVLTGAVDINSRPGIYAALTYTWSAKVPLNDANNAYADPFQVMDIRLGYRRRLSGRCSLEILAGVNNIGDVTYSLGNDINAAGGRYYNAAPGRNYYAGVIIRPAW